MAAATKLFPTERDLILTGLNTHRSVLQRKARAETNPDIVAIVNKDIGAVDVLVAKVQTFQLEF